jgi:hypothetical protein
MSNHQKAILDFINAGRFVLDLLELSQIPRTLQELEEAIGANDLGSACNCCPEFIASFSSDDRAETLSQLWDTENMPADYNDDLPENGVVVPLFLSSFAATLPRY